MSHKKGGGSTKNNRDSNPQYRGCKAFAGQVVTGGSILIRQCGNKFWPGDNVGQGRDYTLFARVNGRVDYTEKNERRYISIITD